MSSEETAIKVDQLSKRYEIYEKPSDRLKQFIIPRIKKLLRLRSKSYFQEFWALADLSFEIKKSETVGIIGRNGSGKSTLLQLICGTLTPTNGEVEIRGRVAALLELGSGFNAEFTGLENIFMSARVLGLETAEIEQRIDQIIDFADIGDFIKQPVKNYSSGMYVRLAFAVIAHVDADILVIDEALAVGDFFFTQKCMRFLRNFMKSGTVLFVSHDTSSIVSLCSRAVWLDAGRVVMQGSPKEVCEAYLQSAYNAPPVLGSGQELQELVESQPDDLGFSGSESPSLPKSIRVENKLHVAQGFGQGGATIYSVQLLDGTGRPLTTIEGGETVTLKIRAQINFEIQSPIVGFFVKDRLGQMLFGDNTYASYRGFEKRCRRGDDLVGAFTFEMPLLPSGDYSVTVSVASGTQENHDQQHWIHDVLIFKSISTRVCNGLIGIPMLKLALNVSPPIMEIP